jgi:hypothetical protein
MSNRDFFTHLGIETLSYSRCDLIKHQNLFLNRPTINFLDYYQHTELYADKYM